MVYNVTKRFMKRILLIVVSIMLSLAMFAQNAAKEEIKSIDLNARMEKGVRAASDWGTFTNFTATDMDGVSHNIQSYLDQGKYVVIDFFCAWCSPCWQYHQSGILESLYTTYGQGGTEEFVVLLVESETTNTAAQITGTNSANTYAGASQGDFTNGGENPIPIIDATTNLAGKVSLYEGYVPSIYVFCPSGYVSDISDCFFNAAGSAFLSAAAGATSIYEYSTAGCPTETSLPMVDITKPNVVQMGNSARISSTVVSPSDVTYAWTFEGGSPETATTAYANVTWDVAGQHNVTLVVTNANGATTVNAVIDVVDCTGGISEFPYVENFESGQGCWDLRSASSTNEVVIDEYSDGMSGLIFSSYNSASNYNQYFISPELHHSGDLDISFKYKKSSSSSTGEKFYLKYSTTGTVTSNFTTIGSVVTATSTSWATYTGVIPADAKYFMINYNTNYQYYLIIDDLRIEANNEQEENYVEGSVANSISVYPNPANDVVNIEAEGLNNVVIFDVTGREVRALGAETTIDISDLEAGVYFFSIETENGTAMKKLVKE